MPPQFQRQRDANDSSANNYRIPGLHPAIVKVGRKFRGDASRQSLNSRWGARAEACLEAKAS